MLFILFLQNIHHTFPTSQLKSSHMKNSKILKRKRTSGSFSLQNFTTFLHHHSKKASRHSICLLALIVCIMFLFLEQTEDFTNPKHNGGAEDADEPVVQREGINIEHGATKGYDSNLSEYDYRGNAYERVTTLEVKR